MNCTTTTSAGDSTPTARLVRRKAFALPVRRTLTRYSFLDTFHFLLVRRSGKFSYLTENLFKIAGWRFFLQKKLTISAFGAIFPLLFTSDTPTVKKLYLNLFNDQLRQFGAFLT